MQSDNNQEHKSYNALMAALDGDRDKLSAAKSAYQTWSATWDASRPLFGKLNSEEEWNKLQKSGVRIILNTDAEFPESLRQIYGAPFGLYIKGSLPDATSLLLAIIGTRKATTAGKSIALKFAEELTVAGATIVSGLALGIDTAAHTGALKADGKTVAILACGLSQIYPAQNENLATEILKNGGAIISEYPLASPAYPSRFIERNRIVSGLSRGVLVIEAPEKSGALATVRFAVEQNRNVYVVPGPITHENYKGSHELIKSGAMLITNIEDVLADLGIETKVTLLRSVPELSGTEALVYAALKNSGAPLGVDKIIEISKLEPCEATRALTFLVVKDIIKECSGEYEIL